MKKVNINNLIKSGLFRNSGVYAITNVINASVPFLMLPILTRYLTAQEYGILSMFTVLTTFISPFIGLNMVGAVARKYYDQEEYDINEYTWNGIIILMFSSIIVGVVLYLNQSFIEDLTSFPANLLWMAILYSVSQTIVNLLLALWQVRKMSLSYGFFNILQMLTNIMGSLFLVYILKLGWKGRIIGQLVALVLFSIIALIILLRKKWIKKSMNMKYIFTALKFGVPLIPHSLSGSIIAMTDRFFITQMVGLDATGIYTVGYQVGSIINILSSSFNNAYVPWLYEKLKNKNVNTDIKIVKLTYLYFITILLGATILGLIAPIVLSIFLGVNFIESSKFVLWIALGYAFNGMYFMVVNYIFFEEKTKYLAGVTFITAIINLGLNFLFINTYGAIGAAIATTITFFIKFVFVWFLSSRVHKMPWNIIKGNINW